VEITKSKQKDTPRDR